MTRCGVGNSIVAAYCRAGAVGADPISYTKASISSYVFIFPFIMLGMSTTFVGHSVLYSVKATTNVK